MTLETMLGQRLAAALEPLLREPAPGDEGMETDPFDEGEEQEFEPSRTPSPGWMAGMALCIPTLSLIGLLYTLLK